MIAVGLVELVKADCSRLIQFPKDGEWIRSENLHLAVVGDRDAHWYVNGVPIEMKDGQIVPKPRKKVSLTCPQLVKADIGGHFCDGDPYWITEIAEEGYQWQIKSE